MHEIQTLRPLLVESQTLRPLLVKSRVVVVVISGGMGRRGDKLRKTYLEVPDTYDEMIVLVCRLAALAASEVRERLLDHHVVLREDPLLAGGPVRTSMGHIIGSQAPISIQQAWALRRVRHTRWKRTVPEIREKWSNR